jgi:ATP-dependent DNA helicase RecG
MKNWETRALDLLERTLNPVPTEINELDWKSTLSDKSERLAQHLSAFSNLPGGGFWFLVCITMVQLQWLIRMR